MPLNLKKALGCPRRGARDEAHDGVRVPAADIRETVWVMTGLSLIVGDEATLKTQASGIGIGAGGKK